MTSMHHVLIVDDDPVLLAVTESIVQTVGNNTVSTASNGVEGLQVLRAANPPIDVIVLDLNMPGMDGLAYLRSLSDLSFTGSVILSSGEAEAVRSAACRMGEMLGVRISGNLQKPLRIGDLVGLLTTCFSSEVPPASYNDMREPKLLQPVRGTLLPYYQPQVDVETKTVVGLEALIRLDTFDGEILGPHAVFHSGVRDTDLPALTVEIAERVMDDVVVWRNRGFSHHVSINLDARVVEVPGVMPRLFELAAERKLEPSSIMFELTETALPNSMSDMIEILARTRMAGFGVSIDDYGTGSSNFSLLRMCPFNELKLDRSIVKAAASDRISRRFMETATATANDLGMTVVAEGVESEEELQTARDAGISIIQGYYYCKPIPAEKAFPLKSL